jgi:hypothetical protein
VPTKDQILVPETLLKKRKSQEKAREQRTAEIEKRKKVGYTNLAQLAWWRPSGDGKHHTSD